jgi:hypothetical protein
MPATGRSRHRRNRHPHTPVHPQIAKLLIIPFVCFVERFYLGRTFSREVMMSIMLVITGVAVV